MKMWAVATLRGRIIRGSVARTKKFACVNAGEALGWPPVQEMIKKHCLVRVEVKICKETK